jgi:hypothetical protein
VGEEISYTIPELESAQKLGRPVDAQKFNGLNLKHQMDIDELVYVGDTLLGHKGLLNSRRRHQPRASPTAPAALRWVNKTPDEILADFNEILTSCWAASGWAVMPSEAAHPAGAVRLHRHQKVSAGRERLDPDLHPREQHHHEVGRQA